MRNRLSRADVYDTNKNTGALILGSNRLDDYAAKYLSVVCSDALKTPMPLPVGKILAEQKLTVIEVRLSRNLDVFGCCLLLDGDVQVYDPALDCMETRHYPARTILIDPEFVALYGEGAKRNTLIHEAVHWEKDKRYFEILQVKNRNASETLYPIMCRSSASCYTPAEGSRTKETEVQWLEWQAHRLAPRILMPREMYRRKALEIIEENAKTVASVEFTCDAFIEKLSSFFEVSRHSAKIRLLEVGLKDTVSQFADYEDVFADVLNDKEFQPISPFEAFELLEHDHLLREWVESGTFIFVDGYFVKADSKYIKIANGTLHLTAAAKRNKNKCVLNIVERRFRKYTNHLRDLEGITYLNRSVQDDEVDIRILLFSPEHQSQLKAVTDKIDPNQAYAEAMASIRSKYPEEDQEEEELLTSIAKPSSTLCECLVPLMQHRHWNAPATFNERTGLHENYFGKIKNNNYNNMGADVLLALCIGLRLRVFIIEKLFEKSQHKLNRFVDPQKTYIRILERFPGISIDDFNAMVSTANLPRLGTKAKNSQLVVLVQR